MNLQQTLVRDRVPDLGTADPIGVEPADSISHAVALMQRERIGCVMVCQGNQLRGLFTERDLLKRVLAVGKPLSAPIESVMTTEPDTLRLTDTVADVIRKMNTGGYRHMPVVDESGGVIGVVSVKRVVQYLVEHFPEAVYNLPPDPAVIATAREGG